MANMPTSYSRAQKNFLTLDQVDLWSVDETTALFVYGSLMFPGVAIRKMLDVVTDEDEDDFVRRMTPATLTKHSRLTVRGSLFCALVDQGTDADTVEGFLILGVTSEEIRRLDRYEAGKYSRESVNVRIMAFERSDSTEPTILQCTVCTYIWAGTVDRLLPATEAVWTPEAFFLSSEYRALVGKEDWREDHLIENQRNDSRESSEEEDESSFEPSTTPTSTPPPSSRYHG